jgi:ABC-type glycerol-3-phosphate transport system permease component
MSTRQMSKSKFGHSIAYAILILITLASLAPVYLMVTGALKTQEEFLASPWSLPANPSFSSFIKVWDEGVANWLKNSVIITGISVAGVVILACLAAWGFARWDFAFRTTLLGSVVSLMVVPPVVLLVPLFQFGARLNWIATYRLVVITYVGLMLPFSIYMMVNFFSTIPRSIFEAAELDGASDFTTFRKIVLPLSGAPIATLSIVNILWAWNELLLALVFLQDPSKKTLMLGIAGLKGRYSLDVPTVMAGMTLVTLPLVLAYILGQRHFIEGLTAGGVKGD